MRSRAWLFGVVAAGVAVALVLLLWPRSTTKHSERKDLPAGAAGAVGDASSGAAGTSPATPPVAARSGGPEDDNNNVMDGGAAGSADNVRDHRGQAPDPGVTRRFAGGRRPLVVQAPVIADLRRTLRPQIEKCGAQHGEDVSPGAQIQGSLRVAVHSGVVSVLDVDVQHRGVAESSGLIECARQAFASVQVRADGHAEVESHVLRLPFRIPVK
jgi:hypothetical protein